MDGEELERFRRQWQAEVSARARAPQSSSSSQPQASGTTTTSVPRAEKQRKQQPPAPAAEPRNRPEDDTVDGWCFDDVGFEDSSEGGRKLEVPLSESQQQQQQQQRSVREPQSALEHYERAVECETKGKLGDSLVHYRKAFRLDERVDVKYKNKHFPPSSFASKPPASTIDKDATGTATATTTKPAHDSSSTSETVSSLIASFATEPIHGARPVIAGDVAPPCPIARLPSELLTHVLLFGALADLASFARLALVCRRFAYLVATEDHQIWKRVCHGAEFGMGGMHHAFAVSLAGKPLLATKRAVGGDGGGGDDDDDDANDGDGGGPLAGLSRLSLDSSIRGTSSDPLSSSSSSSSPSPSASRLTTTFTLPLTPTYPTYRHMQHARPRLRFAGLYISTVNYVRPGASSPTAITWNSPVHVVTYYRYVRFLRRGAALFLTTTAEPGEVVPHFREENVGLGPGAIAAAGGGAGISAVAKNTLRGRWRVSRPVEARGLVGREDGAVEGADGGGGSGGGGGGSTVDDAEKGELLLQSEDPDEPEGMVYLETFGSAPAYTYCLQLALRSVGGGQRAKNTKLVWSGFWSYNRLTDDWGKFTLKNDRPFVWSRVRSWADA